MNRECVLKRWGIYGAIYIFHFVVQNLTSSRCWIIEFVCTRQFLVDSFLDLKFFLHGDCLCTEGIDACIIVLLFFIFIMFFIFTLSLIFIFQGTFLRRPLSVVTILLLREGPRTSKNVALNMMEESWRLAEMGVTCPTLEGAASSSLIICNGEAQVSLYLESPQKRYPIRKNER